MKTIDELIEEYSREALDDGQLELEHLSQDTRLIRDELKRRVRDQELMLWAMTNGWRARWYEDEGGPEWNWIPAQVPMLAIETHFVPRTGPLPELNDELRERLEREWKEAEG